MAHLLGNSYEKRDKKSTHSCVLPLKENGEGILTVFPFHISLWLIRFKST